MGGFAHVLRFFMLNASNQLDFESNLIPEESFPISRFVEVTF